VGFFRHNLFETVSLSAFRDKGLYSIEPLKKLVSIPGLHKKFWLENVCYKNMRYFRQEVRIEKLPVRIILAQKERYHYFVGSFKIQV